MATARPLTLKPADNRRGLNNQPLSGPWPFFPFRALPEKNYFFLFNRLEPVLALGEKLKGRLLIMLKRPLASLTDC